MLKMKKVDLLPNSLVSTVMSFLSETKDAPVFRLSNKQFLEAYKEMLADKRQIFNELEKEGSEFGKVECLQFDPSMEFCEKNLTLFPAVKEVNFISGYKFALRILRSKSFPRDNLLKITLAAPGIILSEGETFLLLRLPKLRRLEILGSNKHQPKVLTNFLQHICLYSKLIYLRLDSFVLDGSLKLPYSLTLRNLRLDLTGKSFDFNLLNIFLPYLHDFELYYIQDPTGRPITGSLRVANFPSLKKMTLRNLRPNLTSKEVAGERIHPFAPFENKKWKTLSYLTLDLLTMLSFKNLDESFENVTNLHIFSGPMDFFLLPGCLDDPLPSELDSVSIEAPKLDMTICQPVDGNPFYENVSRLVLKLEEFSIKTLVALTNLVSLQDLSLILVPLSDGSFSLTHPEFSDSGPSNSAFSSCSSDKPLAKNTYSAIDYDSDDGNILEPTFETLEVLRVTHPTRMHHLIVWIIPVAPYLHTLLSNHSLHPTTKKMCMEISPTLEIHIH